VLAAALVLLLQSLLPAAALAAQGQPSRGETIVVCTQMGLQTIVVGEEDAETPAFAGLPCPDCLTAASAAIVTPSVQVEPAAYAAARVEHAPTAERRMAFARAPPRPPGQGPPRI
jgi:hypothetical protein